MQEKQLEKNWNYKQSQQAKLTTQNTARLINTRRLGRSGGIRRSKRSKVPNANCALDGAYLRSHIWGQPKHEETPARNPNCGPTRWFKQTHDEYLSLPRQSIFSSPFFFSFFQVSSARKWDKMRVSDEQTNKQTSRRKRSRGYGWTPRKEKKKNPNQK